MWLLDLLPSFSPSTPQLTKLSTVNISRSGTLGLSWYIFLKCQSQLARHFNLMSRSRVWQNFLLPTSKYRCLQNLLSIVLQTGVCAYKRRLLACPLCRALSRSTLVDIFPLLFPLLHFVFTNLFPSASFSFHHLRNNETITSSSTQFATIASTFALSSSFLSHYFFLDFFVVDHLIASFCCLTHVNHLVDTKAEGLH